MSTFSMSFIRLPATTLNMALITALFMGLGGCAFIRSAIGLGPQKPRVVLTDIEVRKASPLQVELGVRLRVDNPNDFALTFSRLRYRLASGSVVMAHGTYAGTISIPPEGSSEIALPLTVDPKQAFRVLQKVLMGTEEEVFAVLSATADFETPFGAMEVNFEDRKNLRKLAGF